MILARKLRALGKITTPGRPFEQSEKAEIDTLITRSVFRFKTYNLHHYRGICIFKLRIVNKVKGKMIDQP